MNILLLLVLLLVLELFIGTVGFMKLNNSSFLDSLHNSCMYATTMGPVLTLETNKAKIFSAFYTLLAGLIFFSILIFLVIKIFKESIFSYLFKN
jgi:hypothetical protein